MISSIRHSYWWPYIVGSFHMFYYRSIRSVGTFVCPHYRALCFTNANMFIICHCQHVLFKFISGTSPRVWCVITLAKKTVSGCFAIIKIIVLCRAHRTSFIVIARVLNVAIFKAFATLSRTSFIFFNLHPLMANNDGIW